VEGLEDDPHFLPAEARQRILIKAAQVAARDREFPTGRTLKAGEQHQE
jgi:hypothetical protein